MSYIKRGYCDECGNEFYWSVGHPRGWDKWCVDLSDQPETQQWWFSFGNLCEACAPSFEEWQLERAVRHGNGAEVLDDA